MKATVSLIAPLNSDPDLQEGGILTLERADGRSVWRQRLMVGAIIIVEDSKHYMLSPVASD